MQARFLGMITFFVRLLRTVAILDEKPRRRLVRVKMTSRGTEDETVKDNVPSQPQRILNSPMKAESWFNLELLRTYASIFARTMTEQKKPY